MGRWDSQTKSPVGQRSYRGPFCLVLVLTPVLLALMALVSVVPSAAAASERGAAVSGPEPSGETVWLCKPGIADNPCLETDLGGTSYFASGQSGGFSHSPSRKPGYDCFYVYPTQSTQNGFNADLSRDQELKDVAINQAAQFSRLCNVFAPVYPQYTNQALGSLGSLGESELAEIRDIAYNGVLSSFEDFVANESKGRGFVLIGHSQGASHLSRLIAEEIDPNPGLRRRMISAIVPGSNNIYVPKGESVGGNLENIPACTKGDQLGCVMAWSIYRDREERGLPANASFGRLGTGYWVYPEGRPDPDAYEVLCVNPADLSGASGMADALVNLPVFLKQPEVPEPWTGLPDSYSVECLSGEDSSWLDLKRAPEGLTNLEFVLSQINSTAGGLHTGDINLVLGNLIKITSRQGVRYVNWRKAVERSRSANRALERGRAALVKARRKARKARSACRSERTRRACRKARATEGQRKRAAKKVQRLVGAAKKAAAEVKLYAPD